MNFYFKSGRICSIVATSTQRRVSVPTSVNENIYQILNTEGQLVGEVPELSAETFLSLYRWMVFGRVFSDRMVALQRQGRMGTFAPLNGQEAACVGLAAPLQAKDWPLGSYRDSLTY